MTDATSTVVASVDPASTPLSVLMREGSRVEHQDAESSTFVAELLAGRVNERGYADYLIRFHRVYTTLEAVGRSLADRADPVAAAVLDPALERRAAIEADLAFWGPYASPSIRCPAAEAYIARIEESATWGGLFLAHHYTRYLGDLSGGQVIGRALERTYDLAEGQGTALYRFTDIAKPKRYKDAYRARLDALPLNETEKHRVLGEVKTAFALNGAIFTELTENLAAYRRP